VSYFAVRVSSELRLTCVTLAHSICRVDVLTDLWIGSGITQWVQTGVCSTAAVMDGLGTLVQ
jgi:hypothetical protein